MPLDPPPIKKGPGMPRKNRVKDPHENPKKQGKLTRHGIEMTCSSCKRKGHNKRSCPNKGSTSAPAPPQPKRKRGRPKSTGEATTPTVHMHESQVHHDNTVEPGRIGKRGKLLTQAGGEEEGQLLGPFRLLKVEEEEAEGKGEAVVVLPMSGQPVVGPPIEGNNNVNQGGSNQLMGSQHNSIKLYLNLAYNWK
ncbi:Transcription factor MYBS3 [Bienertia sinuspersici]